MWGRFAGWRKGAACSQRLETHPRDSADSSGTSPSPPEKPAVSPTICWITDFISRLDTGSKDPGCHREQDGFRPLGGDRRDAPRARHVTSGSPAVSSLSWMPNGGIVYSNRNGELVALRPDGSNRTVLAPGEKNSSPVACGDGRYVVFSSFRNEKLNVWRIEEDGSNPTQLTSEAFAGFPSCSPDGRWVLYDLTISESMWRMPVQGGVPTQLKTPNRNSPRAESPRTERCWHIQPGSHGVEPPTS